MAVTVQRREVVFQGRIFQVRRDWVQLPDGRVTSWDILQHPGAVTIVPVDGEGYVWFVRQYRHAVGETLLEFPAGTLEPTEAPLSCAQRELAEEIGQAAAHWRSLGTFYLAPGYSSERMEVFLAQDLSPRPASLDADEILQPERYPLAQVATWMRDGTIRDAKTLAAWLLAEPYLQIPMD